MASFGSSFGFAGSFVDDVIGFFGGGGGSSGGGSAAPGLDALATGLEIVELDRSGREIKRDASQQAAFVRRAAEEEAQDFRTRARRAAAAQRARIGASGVSGSPLLVVQETLLFAFEDIARIRRTGSEVAFRIARRGRRQRRAATAAGVIRGVRGLARLSSQQNVSGR